MCCLECDGFFSVAVLSRMWLYCLECGCIVMNVAVLSRLWVHCLECGCVV